jgi:Na+/H+ antiporter NhaD/arsenite permease-like protein
VLMLAKDLVLDLVQQRGAATQPGTSLRERIYARLPTLCTCVGRLPPDLMPFMLGMFVLVEALKVLSRLTNCVILNCSSQAEGVLQLLADGLTAALAPVGFSAFATVGLVGLASTALCSVLNNQPMAILVSTVVQLSALPPAAKRAAMLSASLGSNFGANLSFVASLAGLMFVAILQPFAVTVSQGRFSRAGLAVMPPVLAVSCALLAGETLVFGL